MLRTTLLATASLLSFTASAVAQDVAGPLAPAATAPPAEPAITISGGVTGASQYRFRGISLSDEKAAIEGTINPNHDSGFYLGTWASSLDGFGQLGGSNLELDLYGGYNNEIGAGFTADVGLVYHAYPGSKGGDYKFFEPYANVSHAGDPATTKVGVAIAPSQKALGDKSNFYTFGDVALPIGGTSITLNSHIGWSKSETALTPGEHYVDWAIGASSAWRQLTFGVTYADTNISAREALSVGATKEIVDSKVVDLTDAVASAAHDLQPILVDHPLKLDVSPSLPLVSADAQLLHHCLINLIENAAKYSKSRTPILIAAKRLPDGIDLAIVDEGPGFPPGDEERGSRLAGCE